MERADHDELLRCRERLHALETSVVAATLLLEDLREWRTQARVQLDKIVKADEIAEAVSTRLEDDRTARRARQSNHLTVWQTRAAVGGIALTATIAVAGGVHQFVMWL